MGQAADTMRKYVELYSDGTTELYGSDRCLALFAPDADCFFAPTSLHPLGERGGVELFEAGFEANAAVLRNRKIELLELIESADKAAWNGIWTAFIGVDGLPVPEGATAPNDIDDI